MSSLTLVQRAAATTATMAKYRSQAFDWRARATCIHMARFHLRRLGHTPPPIPDFRSALGARKALEKTGFADLPALLDSLLERIAPASVLVGDIVILRGDEGFDSICIWAGGKFLGWHGDDPSGIKPQMALDPANIIGAWRV
ncbi:DUF6950 family protein [Sphingobium indicum]|uniref:DUF6950 family protein n=1 Tax=Sphingobium TaxID=165695 RepID=UPI0003876814|nr:MULTISPECIES: hypothetical protein [Sphingobium]EQB05223.1 hypothetical protein L286_08365 [Sphingobium sp. HDIP04]